MPADDNAEKNEGERDLLAEDGAEADGKVTVGRSMFEPTTDGDLHDPSKVGPSSAAPAQEQSGTADQAS